jgi:hypothetical protein
MKVNVLKYNIACFFLILFLSLKMVGLHALSHDDDHDTPCQICSHAFINNLIPALTPESVSFSLENTELVFNHVIITGYHFKISNTIATSQLFSRPPPFFI